MAKTKTARELKIGDRIEERARGKVLTLTVLETGSVTRGKRAGFCKFEMEDENGGQWNWKMDPDKVVTFLGKAKGKQVAKGKARRDEIDQRKQEQKQAKMEKRYKAMEQAEVKPWNYVGMMADVRFRDGNRKRQIMRITKNSVYVRRSPGFVDISSYRRDHPELPVTRRDIRNMDALDAIATLGSANDAPKTRRIDIRFLDNVAPAENKCPVKLTATDTKKLNKGETVRKQYGSEFIERSYVIAKDPNTVADRRYDYDAASGTTFRDPETGFCWRATGAFD